MGSSRESVVVIGSGIQGVTVALALAARGLSVIILERSDDPFNGASLYNEGKLHLGFVYALDQTGRTAGQMIEGALSFTPLLERWCGDIEWASGRSDAFAYAVMDGGLADAPVIEDYYHRVSAMITEAGRTYGLRYLGEEMAPEVARGTGGAPGLRPGLSSAWFSTPERSVDPRIVRHHLMEAVRNEPLVEVRTRCEVLGASKATSGFRLDAATPDGPRTVNAERVVNCAWENRAGLDRQVLGEAPAMCYRIKHQVIARAGGEHALQPLTLVQGPYGDVVPWPNGDVYVSWYPVSRTWFGDAPKPDFRPDAAVAEASLDELKKLVPGLQGFTVSGYGACHIVAAAESDIDDAGSGLHSRSMEQPVGVDGWWSLSGGKLTTAPLASERCAAAITGTEIQL
jgi:glycine/D-amino acid oxidase-like deaminating enzyme